MIKLPFRSERRTVTDSGSSGIAITGTGTVLLVVVLLTNRCGPPC
jgi:hypothetical protein